LIALPRVRWFVIGVALLQTLATQPPAHAADAAFTQFIASLWPEAREAGVSRTTFDTETRGLEPDTKLPDLLLPGRPATGAPSQAEFVQVPADYIKEASIARLAAEGQRLMVKHRADLRRRRRSILSPHSLLVGDCKRFHQAIGVSHP
jgi:membrane-bound lytic murein transglycosylase B